MDGDDGDSDRPLRPLTSYERNKQNNMKSNIVLPTALSTSTDDSTCVDDSSRCEKEMKKCGERKARVDKVCRLIRGEGGGEKKGQYAPSSLACEFVTECEGGDLGPVSASRNKRQETAYFPFFPRRFEAQSCLTHLHDILMVSHIVSLIIS